MISDKLRSYWENFVDEDFVVDDDVPHGHCDACRLKLYCDDCYLVCKNCGSCYEKEPVVTVSDLNEMKHCTRTIYKEINHFTAVLNMVQNKERKQVPQYVVDEVAHCLSSTDCVVDMKNIRQALKTNHYVKYYKQSSQILRRIKNNEIKHLTLAEEHEIKQLFREVYYTYNQIKGNTKRVNFLNYGFVAARLLYDIGRHDLSILCKPLSKEAHKKHVRIWSQMQKLNTRL